MTTATKERPALKERTLPEKILLAAADLGEGPKKIFAAEELAVAAWQQFPKEFGLSGFEHPDNNKSLSVLMGEKGLVKRGYLERVQSRKYVVTDLGRQAIQAILRDELPPKAKVTAPEDPLPDFAETMLASVAAKKLNEGNKHLLSFTEACAFWGIPKGMPKADAKARLAYLEIELRKLAENGGPHASVGRYLKNTDQSLRVHFAKHLRLQGLV